ncbi:MAG: family 16 glycosylhydrolase [Chitinophagales bacterium]|nr:family 16 glycosylhydrolase [Chitinophagales bacterium]
MYCFFIKGYAQLPDSSYTLFWEDEFEGTELDLSKWGYRNLGVRRDAFNVPECVTVQNGYLALRTERKNDSIFSAMISTQKKMETTYGYFEIKCLLQTEIGHWSAFWLQSPTLGKYIGNPAKSGAEIDIMEYLPNNQILYTIPCIMMATAKTKKRSIKKIKLENLNASNGIPLV